MKMPRVLLFAFFAFVFPTSANAQDPHVHSRYLKETKTTVVETDWMYLINTQQQFLQLGLITRFADQRPEKPPKKIDVVIYAYSKSALYRSPKPQALKLNVEEVQLNIFATTYTVFKGETKNGQDIFWNEKRTEMGQPSVLPKEALVKGSDNINDLFLERLHFELPPEQLANISQAKKVGLELGQTRIDLAQSYLDTIRYFSSRLVPGTDPATEKPPSSTEPQNIGVVNGRAISLPRPAFPSLAKSSGASGAVNVLITIDESGRVIAARALSGHPLLREGAVEAAKVARFSPTMVDGKPVKVTGVIIYNFVP